VQGKLVRVVVTVGLLGALVLAAHLAGWTRHFSVDEVRTLIASAGIWGMLMYVGVCAVGHLLHVPGLALVAAGVLAWGRLSGGALAYLAAIIAMTACFVTVRAIGGSPLAELKHRHARRILQHLEDRPIRTVALVRLTTWLAPSMTYALALSSVRLRDYVLGSALGLAIPLAVFASLFGVLFKY
jgi:uncharacterized membrane protein YdjX (TVP38/TMEM64 family)